MTELKVNVDRTTRAAQDIIKLLLDSKLISGMNVAELYLTLDTVKLRMYDNRDKTIE